MLIPNAYYDQLPRELPKTAILQGPGGRSWNVKMKMKREEVYFDEGWAKFVADNSIRDGEFLTFVYDGDRIFEVSIYCRDGYKQIQEVTEEDKEKSGYSVSNDDTDNCSSTEMEITIPECREKGKSKVDVVEDSDDEEDSVVSLSSENTETDLESSDKELESDCSDCEQSSNSDGSYAPDNEDTLTHFKLKVSNRNRGSETRKVEPKIENQETYLDNPKNLYFETYLKNAVYYLFVPAQVVKDHCLTFGDHIEYMDKFGKLKAKTAKWQDKRVCIKKWSLICKRNKLKKEDRVLCELLRKKDYVYAIKLHIISGKDL